MIIKPIFFIGIKKIGEQIGLFVFFKKMVCLSPTQLHIKFPTLMGDCLVTLS
jgi:hypothetical protein